MTLQTFTRLGLALGLLLAAAPAIKAAEVSLKGVVRDNTGKPVPNTAIRIYDAAGKQIPGKHATRQDGSYYVSISTESRNISVDFDSAFFHVRGLRALSTQTGDDHLINPVLLDKRGPNSFGLILEQISTYDTIFWREYGDQPTDETRDRLRQQYLERISGMPDPRRLDPTHPGLYAADAPQRKVLSKLTQFQKEILQSKLEGLQACYYEEPTTVPAPAPPAPAPTVPAPVPEE